MKNFFAMFFASLTAMIVGVSILFLMVFASIISMTLSAFNEPQMKTRDNSILIIHTSNIVGEQLDVSPFAYFDFNTMEMRKPITTLQAVSRINKAANDSTISSIALIVEPNSFMGIAQAQEVRNALKEFKKSGKKIYSYGKIYSHNDYYLASVSDKVIMNPEGLLEWNGISMESMFFGEMLEKINVDITAIKHGRYKTSLESFTHKGLSQASLEQNRAIVRSAWNDILLGVSTERHITPERLNEYAERLMIGSPADAIERNLVDSLLFGDQVEEFLKSENSGEYNTITLAEYVSVTDLGTPSIEGGGTNEIALVFIEGEIIDGKSGNGYVGDISVIEDLRLLRKDDNVKAVVLRINSPGGSAMAAALIAREVELLQKEKPVIASFGNLAASGGYYIAAPTDMIIASSATITGSIGVFGIHVNMEKALNNTLGIDMDIVKSNRFSDLGSPFRPITSAEELFMQNQVDRVYTSFVQIVAKGRNLTFEEADNVAQGRVWSGSDAMRVGLVDGLGGIEDAIMLAADRAGVADNFTIHNPLPEDPTFMDLLNFAGNGYVHYQQTKLPKFALSLMADYEYAARLAEGNPIQARIPFRVGMSN